MSLFLITHRATSSLILYPCLSLSLVKVLSLQCCCFWAQLGIPLYTLYTQYHMFCTEHNAEYILAMLPDLDFHSRAAEPEVANFERATDDLL